MFAREVKNELAKAGYVVTRVYRTRSGGDDAIDRWAAIRPFSGGFAIASGDLRFLHNELWWFQTYKQAMQSLDAWSDGIGSPPSAGSVGPRMISRRGKLQEWNTMVKHQ